MSLFSDVSGNIEARYTYDTWGKLVSITDENDIDRTTDTDFIGYINPIRYRSYYYDSETGLYYLNARYYDPETCRFLNADETLKGGYNLFRYCYNNPVNMEDKTGKKPWDRFANESDAYWDAAVYLQNDTLADPTGQERATLIIMRTDPYTGTDYYTYPDPAVGTSGRSVIIAQLLRDYLRYSPSRLFLHTHGKYDSKYDNEHFSCYVDKNGVEVGDLPAADYYKIQLGLITPKGKSLLYDGTSGIRGIPREFLPPPNITIPRQDRYDVPVLGFFRRLFD